MPEGTENEDQVDLDDDNYIEEMDDEVEEQIEDDGARGGGNENGENQHEDLRSEDSGKDQLLEVDRGEADRSNIANELVEDEEKTTVSIDEDDKEKCAELLAVPSHGSEIFVGGLPRDVSEKDLRDLCQSMDKIFEVKALYVKNIPENTPTEQVKQLFQRHGEVSKVVMPPAKSGGKRNFGFVHYAERSSALKAVKDAEKYEIDGQELEVCLAKPQSDKKFDWTNPYITGPCPNYIAHPGYGGFPRNPYGSLGARYGATIRFQQPVIYGRGPMPEGMHMVPMVLPDGRIGYVLQQPGVQMPLSRPRRNDWSNSSSGTRGGNADGNRSRR